MQIFSQLNIYIQTKIITTFVGNYLDTESLKEMTKRIESFLDSEHIAVSFHVVLVY